MPKMAPILAEAQKAFKGAFDNAFPKGSRYEGFVTQYSMKEIRKGRSPWLVQTARQVSWYTIMEMAK